MSYKCSICAKNERVAIDRMIVEGGALTVIAEKFSLAYSSLYRHSQKCISRQLSQAWEKKTTIQSHDLLSKIDNIITKAEDIFERNYKDKRDHIALKALDSQRNTIDLLAKISYNLHQAKIAELQLMQEKSGVNDQEMNLQYQEDIQILTLEELKVFDLLVNKINSQSKEVIIPNQKPTKRKQGKKPQKRIRGANVLTKEESGLKTKLARKKPKFQTSKELALEVKPVEPTEITYTKKKIKSVRTQNPLRR